MKLYGYWRSSAAFRLRIALNLKGLDVEHIPVDIKNSAREQHSAEYLGKNPQGRVPSIETDQGVSGQSMAILEWLEETHPEPSIMPKDAWARLQCRAFADTIACDIHPLNNLSVLSALRKRFDADESGVNAWYISWIETGFSALEETLNRSAGKSDYLFGTKPSIAEICLVPQMWNARRFEMKLSAFPRLLAAEAKALELDAFQKALPENQDDAP